MEELRKVFDLIDDKFSELPYLSDESFAYDDWAQNDFYTALRLSLMIISRILGFDIDFPIPERSMYTICEHYEFNDAFQKVYEKVLSDCGWDIDWFDFGNPMDYADDMEDEEPEEFVSHLVADETGTDMERMQCAVYFLCSVMDEYDITDVRGVLYKNKDVGRIMELAEKSEVFKDSSDYRYFCSVLKLALPDCSWLEHVSDYMTKEGVFSQYQLFFGAGGVGLDLDELSVGLNAIYYVMELKELSEKINKQWF